MGSTQAHVSGVLVCASLLAAACGGGHGSATSAPPADPIWTAGVYQSPAAFVAHCAQPRTGTDPTTGLQYADTQGSSDWENNWLRSWTNAYYLWYREVPDLSPADYSTGSYFNLLKTSAITPSGTLKDHFHFTYPTAQWLALSQAGVVVGYGATWSVLAGTPPRKVLVAYTEPNSPATAAGADLARGASILAIDGVDLVNASDAASVVTLNAGLSPSTPGEMHSFTLQDTPGAASRTVSLAATTVTETPVQNVKTYTVAGGVVGYMLFNDHIASAEPELFAAFAELAQSGVSDLVLDIRYNGGGYLDIASEVAFMIAGPGATSGQTFELQQFNDKYPTSNPITGAPLTPTQFHSTSQGFSGAAGQALPHLDLNRVFVLSGTRTCSASEAIINGLRGVNVEVIQIGSVTCGKPYGFYPPDNCGTTYFSIQFKGVNAQGFGDYSDGFVPANAPAGTGVPLPGCSVADDFTHALGDQLEGRLAAALTFRESQSCPTASGIGSAEATAAGDGRLAKPEALMNRVLHRRS